MNQKTLFISLTLIIPAVITSSPVQSAGFQLNEFSSSGLGRAYSGEGAIADNAGSTSRNPATIMMFNRPAFSGGGTFVAPDVNITGRSPSGQSLNANNIAPDAWVPNLHFVAPINDQFGWRASVTSNYGMATEFDKNYAGGTMGGTTDLQTLNLNLSGAYRLNSNWSFGVGVDAVYARAKIERYAGDIGQLAAGQILQSPMGQMPAGQAVAGFAKGIAPDTNIAHLKGDDWGVGWNAGLLYELDKNNRYAFTYRSEVKINFKNGRYKSDLPTSAQLASRLAGITGAGRIASGALTDFPAGTGGATIPGSLNLNLPEVWEASGYNRVAPQWAIHYSLAYTRWSQFQELRAKGNGGNTLFYKDEGFKDAYRVALGTSYYMNDTWTFRTGAAYDDSPVPANKRSISIPDQNRVWVSAGTTYAFNTDTSVDLGVSYMHGQHVSISEGPYQFKSSGRAWLYGMNFNYVF